MQWRWWLGRAAPARNAHCSFRHRLAETVCDITVVGAVFPSIVAIGCKLCTAPTASKAVERFLVHAFGISVPPCQAAFIGAKPFSFCARRMLEWLAAVLASLRIGDRLVGYIIRAEIVSAAERLHGVFGYAKRSGYSGVAFAFGAQLFYAFFL